MKPSICRMVVFTDASGSYPAVITKVWSDICVNLVVFGSPRGAAIEVTSVTNMEGSSHSWKWPERV